MSEILKTDKIRVNYKNICEGRKLLQEIKDESLKVIFFDPQYRGILDKLAYGNEGEGRGKGRSDREQMTEEDIQEFLREIIRCLKPSGYLFLWIDKFHLVEGVQSWFQDYEDIMQNVDLIVWDKQKLGMGYRTRRISEYCLVIQKQPVKAKETWVLHDIPDVWSETAYRNHPHAKPIELQKQLIMATTDEGDYVCDPASGGYSVFNACQETMRNFIGGDIEFGDDFVEFD